MKIPFEKIFNTIGFGLLGVCIVLSLGQVITRSAKEANTDQITIRLAHWQLEGGIKAAFDEVAKEYTKLHPNVKIEQMLVPERIYPNWATTQLIGGTAPDIIELGKGADSGERVARFFLPSTDIVDKPNPYNKGTDLENTPWRSTFFDGMEGAYREDLAEYYGIPCFNTTVRLYYNRTLMKEITGKDEVPTTYDELAALCEEVSRFAARPENSRRKLLALAGSKYNSPILIERLMASQTQLFRPLQNDMPLMTPSGEDAALNYLKGEWKLESEPIRLGLELQRDLGKYMPPGFLQLGREDSTLYFIQQRALMIATGSWDASSIYQLADEAKFEIGAFQVPFPDKNHPRYGKYTAGVASEANSKTFAAFAVYRGSKHRDVAYDFLAFLTSRKGNTIWSHTSKWPPVIVGVEPHERTVPFMPIAEGAIDGLTLRGMAGNLEASRLVDSKLSALMDPNGSVDKYIDAIEPDFGKLLTKDLREGIKNRLRSVRRQDGNIISVIFAKEQEPDDPRTALKYDSLWENQISQELLNAHINYELEAVAAGEYKDAKPADTVANQ